MTTTKRDELEGLPDDPPAAGKAPSASSLEQTARIQPPPLDDGQLVEWTGPLPAPAKRRKQDRQAGPSEKHVYVPPVTLPPTKGPSALDQQKIMVAPSVLKPTDNSRNQPTIRKIPTPIVPAAGAAGAQAQPDPALEAGNTTLKTGVEPGPAQAQASAQAKGQAAPAQARAKTAPGKASPWDKGGVAAVDRDALPSAQLLASTGSRARATPAKPEPQRSRTGLVVGMLLAGVAAASIYFLVAWPDPKPAPDTPINVGAPEAPATWVPAPLPTPPSTAAEPSTAAAPSNTSPSEAPSIASPPATTPPAETAAAPPSTPPEPSPSPRPPSTGRPPVTTAKPPATAKPPPTAEQPSQPQPPPDPPPTSTTTAPPRPF